MVTSDRVLIHSCIDREEVDVLAWVFVKLNDLFVVRSVLRCNHRFVHVLLVLIARHIWRVVVPSSVHDLVEQELERCLRPRKVDVLLLVNLAPLPVFLVLGYLFLHELSCVSEGSSDVVCTRIVPLVFRVGHFAELAVL